MAKPTYEQAWYGSGGNMTPEKYNATYGGGSSSSSSSSNYSGTSGSTNKSSSGSSSSGSSKPAWQIKLEQLANDPAGLKAEIERTAGVLATQPTAAAGDWLSKLSGLAKNANQSPGVNLGLYNNGTSSSGQMPTNPSYNPAGAQPPQPIQQPQPTQAPQPQQQPSNPYLIPLQQWFAGKDIANTGGNLSVGGFNFTPGSYEARDGGYYMNPMTLASAYLTKPQSQMTPDMYNESLDVAEQFYAPQRQSKLDALKQVMQDRAQATRRGAIGRGTYTSPTYTENIIQQVEKPYAQEQVNLENNMSSLENAMAKSEVDKKLAGEKELTNAIVQFLLGVNDNAQDIEWQKVLQSIAQQGNILSA